MNRMRIDMTVRNHPGVMSHIAGIFSGRSVNIDEIVCKRTDDHMSCMSLVVLHSDRALTIVKQLENHYDVISLHCHDHKDNEA
jgi:acetolactate synthase-1/3 small subunit